LGFRARGSRRKVQGLGFRVAGLGFRMPETSLDVRFVACGFVDTACLPPPPLAPSAPLSVEGRVFKVKGLGFQN
jgi:hypothetical protein